MHPYTIASRRLKEFLDDPRTLNVVHYACETFYGFDDTSPTRICAIAVMHVGAKESKVFSIHRFCLDNENFSTTDAESYKSGEIQLLSDFFGYAAEQGSHARWLHWNMNSESYGFAHLEHRYKQLFKTEPFHIPEANRLDLDDCFQGIYGQFYMCDPKLVNLIKQNGLPKKDMMSGDKEAYAFTAGKWKEIHDSAHDKVGIIYELSELASLWKLRTHVPTWRAHFSGWLHALIVDHPIRFAIGAIVGTIGLIASIIQIVSALPHPK